MAINQISTSNTFGQWLTATQALVTKYNIFEADYETVNVWAANTETTAANVYSTWGNVVTTNTQIHLTAANVYSTNVNVYARADEVFNYVGAAYNTANIVANTSQAAWDKSNVAYNQANISFNIATVAGETSNTANATANIVITQVSAAYNTANIVLVVAQNSYNIANASAITANNAANSAQIAYDSANTFLAYVANNANITSILNDTTTDNNQRYILFSQNTSGILAEAYVSDTKLYYNPSTGTLSSTNFNSLSDQSLKTNVRVINNSIDVVNQIEGVEFTWKDSGLKSYGVIAQEIEKIIPELVDGETQKTVNYSGLIAFLINSIKELDARVKQLENNINKE
jgi:hypothetical protein